MLDLSHYAFNLFSLPPLLTSIGVLILGLVVLARERLTRVTVLFFLMSLSTVIWFFGFSWMYSATQGQVALAWAKAGHIGVALLPATVYHFSVAVLRIDQRQKTPVFIIWSLSGLFGLATFATDTIVAGVQSYWWGYYPIYGWLSGLFVIFFLSTMIGNFTLYRKELRDATYGRHKARIKSFMVGFGISYIASVDFLAAYGIPVYPFGYLPVFIFMLMSAYTTWRYRLVDLTPVFAASQILEMMHGAVLVVDNTGVIRGVNPATCSMLDYREGEILGMPLEKIVKSSDIKKIPDGRLLMHTLINDGTMVWMGKKTRKIDVGVSTSKVSDQNGFLIGEVYVAMDITERKQAENKIIASNRLLSSINRIQSHFIANVDPRVLFDQLLTDILSLTESEYGFIGDILRSDSGEPHLKTRAITHRDWNDAARKSYDENAPTGPEFSNLKLLLGTVISSGRPVVSNNPSNDPGGGGIPEVDHSLNHYFGLPVYLGEKLIGMVGMANRPGGYDEELAEYLKPLLNTCANIIERYRNDPRQKQAEEIKD